MLAYIEVIVALAAIFALSYEFLWPLLYWYKARKYGNCGKPTWQMWHPLAIASIVDQIRAVKQHRLLEIRQADFDIHNKSTILKQSLLEFEFITKDPENIRAVYSSQFTDFVNGEKSRILASAFGWGIFMLDGNAWKHSRALLRPQFARDQVSRLEQIQAHTNDLIRAIPDAQFVDMQTLFHMFTMDTATEFLLGVSVHSLATEKAPLLVINSPIGPISSQDFIESYQVLQSLVLRIMIMGSLGYILNHSKTAFHRRRIQLFVEHIVLNPVVPRDPSTWVLAHELAKSSSSLQEVRDHLISILLAGRDTTGSTLSFATYFLSHNPHIWRQLREECLDAPPHTAEDLKQLPMLNAVISETLRLAPPVPLNFKEAARDTTLPRGGGADESERVFVPKGTIVAMSPHALQRTVQYWGKDAETFRPERWLGANIPSLHPWAYIPFSGGPRICLGQQFALVEISLCLCMLSQKFQSLEPIPGSPSKPPMGMSVTLGCGNGVSVRFST